MVAGTVVGVGAEDVTVPLKGGRVVDGVGRAVGSGMPRSVHVQKVIFMIVDNNINRIMCRQL